MAISNTTDRFNGVVASLAIKVRCVVAVEVNVADLSLISNPYSGVDIEDLDRVLLTAQTDPIENGVWNAMADGVWERAFDWDGNRDVEKGSTVWAGQEIGEDKLWQVQTEGTILPGSTAQSITVLLDPEIPTQNNPIVLAELVNPGADVDGFGQIWVREDTPNVLVFRDDTGIDTVLGAGGGGVVVQDEGVPLATTADTLDFVGAGVVASGVGSTKTITISGGGGGGAVTQIEDPSANVAVIALGGGTIGIRSVGNSDAENRDLEWQHQDGTTRFSIGQESSTAIIVRNHITGADIIFRVGTGGGNRTRLQLTGDQTTGGIVMSAGTNPSGGHLRVFDDGVRIQNTMLFIRQESDAEADIATFGQIWVRDDNPQTLLFRDDDGTDFVLNGAGGGVTVEDEGTPLATIADTLDFVGAGVVASGVGGTKTITISGTGGGGFQGLGIWRYRTAVTSTPSTGQMQFDDLTIDNATEMYIHESNDGGTDMTAFLDLIVADDLVYVQIQADASQFVTVEVGTPSKSTGVYTFPIQIVEGQGSAPTNNSTVAIIAIHGAGTGGGETNTGSNQGTDGVGVFDTKSGVDLQFRNVAPASSKITVVLNGKDVDVDIVEANIDHDALANFTSTEHFTQAAISIPASQISDFDTEVGNNASVAANTSKVTNATHTGQVTGATALALAVSAITAQPAAGALVGGDTFIVNDGGVLSEISATDMATFFGGGAEVNDLSSVVTWANIPDANVPESAVTQHEAAIDHDALTGFVAGEHLLESAIDHDALTNFLAAEHIDWAVTGAEDIHADRLPASSGSTFTMVTPVVISFGGDDTWETISNAALATAGATHALIKCFCQIAPTAGGFATQIIHLRETGSAIAKATSNRACIAGEEDTSAVGITTDTNDAWVELNSNQDFDILQDQTGVGSQVHQAWIVGYMA